MQNFLSTLWNDESGQDLAEYALLLVLIALVVVGAVTLLGERIEETFQGAADEFPLDGGGDATE